MRALARLIAELSHSRLVVLPTANSNAHRVAETLPVSKGLNARQSWERTLRSYVMMGFDPMLDTAQPTVVHDALRRASFVVSISSFDNDWVRQYANVILPMACFAETSGTFIGVDQRRQHFAGAVAPRGDSRPGWKILRVLGNISKLKGFDYISSQDVVDEIESPLRTTVKKGKRTFIPDTLALESDLMLISEVGMYRSDSLVRHSQALQQTPENLACGLARINSKEADRRGLDMQHEVVIRQDERQITVPLEIDDNIADGCIYLAAATVQSAQLGSLFSQVQVSRAEIS